MKLYILGCLLSCLLIAGTSNANTLTIQADVWFPINGDPHSNQPGYMIELARAILEPEGYDVIYEVSPWNRAIYNTKTGNTDCVVGATPNEAAGLLLPEQHWGIAESGIYVKASDPWRFNSLDDLLSRKTGLTTGYEYGEELDPFFVANRGNTFQFISGPDPLKINLSKLLAGKIDGLIETTMVFDAYLLSMGLSTKIVNAGTIGPKLPLFIACTDKYIHTRQAIHIINEALPRMRANGELANILGAYGLSVWDPE